MRHALIALCLLGLSCSDEGAAGAAGQRTALASARPETAAAATLTVASSAFAAGGTIPLRFSAYGEGASPEIAWSGVPAGTLSLALMMEDPDAVSVKPFVHWLAWDIDPTLGRLPENLTGADGQRLTLAQGRNSRGKIGYFGPRPHGTKPHRYHFQLFALDARPALAAGADRETLLAAMKGHVLAKGDLLGLFAAPKRERTSAR